LSAPKAGTILGAPDLDGDDVEAQPPRRLLNLAHLHHGAGIADTVHDRQAVESGDNLAQEFESLAGRVGVQARQAGNVPARPGEARDEACADWVRRHREDDRNLRCHLFRRNDSIGSKRDNDIDLEPNELGRELAEALRTSLRPTIVDRDVVTLGPAELAQPLRKGGEQFACGRRCAWDQEPDLPRLRRLHLSRKWRGEEAARQRTKEGAP
jgi:hypothetical protein